MSVVTADITQCLLKGFPTNTALLLMIGWAGCLFCSGQKSKPTQSSFEKDGIVIVWVAGLELSTRNRAAEKGQRKRKAGTVSSYPGESLDRDSGWNWAPALMRSSWEKVGLDGEQRKRATAREAQGRCLVSRLNFMASSSRKISGLPRKRIRRLSNIYWAPTVPSLFLSVTYETF